MLLSALVVTAASAVGPTRPIIYTSHVKGVLNFVKQGRIYSQEFALGDKTGV